MSSDASALIKSGLWTLRNLCTCWPCLKLSFVNRLAESGSKACFKCRSQRQVKNCLSYALKPSSKSGFVFLDAIIHHLQCLRLVPMMWLYKLPVKQSWLELSSVKAQYWIPFGLGCPCSAACGAGCQEAPWGRNASLQGEPWISQTRLPSAYEEKHPRECKVEEIQYQIICDTLYICPFRLRANPGDFRGAGYAFVRSVHAIGHVHPSGCIYLPVQAPKSGAAPASTRG